MAHSIARERVLHAAEALFIQRGYEAVTVKDIAKKAGIHHASIYHHIPGGKSALFVEIMTRHLNRHKAGIQAALVAAPEDDLRAQLIGISAWMLSQPAMDLLRLTNSDLPAIDPQAAQSLEYLAYATMLLPIESILRQAQQRGEINPADTGNIAGAILSSIQGLHTIPDRYVLADRLTMAEQLIDVFIRGMTPIQE